jgi:amino acid transporter
MNTQAGFPQMLIALILGNIGGGILGHGLKDRVEWYVFVIALALIALSMFFIYAGAYSQDKANR